MRMTLQELAELTGAELEGDPARLIEGAAGLADASERDIAFLENPKYASRVRSTKAGAVILPPSSKGSPGPRDRLYAEAPRWAYAQVLAVIERERRRLEPPGIHATAVVHYEARLGKDVSVGPHVVIQGRTLVGERTSIGAHAYLGYNVRIGRECVIHPNVCVMDYCELGDRVILHPGTVVGSDGYGYWTDPKTGVHLKVPQVGRVVVESDVEAGSNVSIDRATTGETRIGAGTKIDNLVQIGHNVTIGRNCLLVSQVGLAGSTEVGNQVTLAGQVGVAGHLSIGDGAVITAQSGIMGDVPAKAILFGSPARPRREAMKLQALLGRLPEMYETLRELKGRLPGEKTAQ